MKKLFHYFTKHQVVRYIIGGGTSAVVNLATLYVFNSIFHIYYLVASIFSFFIAFVVSWAFHKFWTFKDISLQNAHRQIGLYLMTSVVALGLNTIIIYTAVSRMNLPVLVGQIIAGILVACCTFSVSKYIVFRHEPRKAGEALEEFL